MKKRNEKEKMPNLIYIPVIHTPQDLGVHLEKVKKKYVAKYGLQRWYQHLKKVDELWQKIREKLTNLQLDYKKVRLYQDGLPVCGQELDIINELANDGSVNHQLLLELVERGATVMGTEELDLLLQERDRLINGMGKSPLSYDELMKQRDEYIAQRIDSTLKNGEIGLLFMGALHRVVEKLPDDIKVRNLFDEVR